eukprot:gene8908-856_t
MSSKLKKYSGNVNGGLPDKFIGTELFANYDIICLQETHIPQKSIKERNLRRFFKQHFHTFMSNADGAYEGVMTLVRKELGIPQQIKPEIIDNGRIL